MNTRPSGVTVLSATCVVAGILMLINGSILASSTPAQKMTQFGVAGLQVKMPFILSATIDYGIGVVMFAIGVASIFTAYGLLKGDSWARTGMIVFTSAGMGIFVIVATLFNFVEVANLIINGSILLYLFKPNVRNYFKSEQTQAPAVQS
jgi:hypothetical protein